MKVRAVSRLLHHGLLQVLDEMGAQLLRCLHARKDKSGLQGPKGLPRDAELI